MLKKMGIQKNYNEWDMVGDCPGAQQFWRQTRALAHLEEPEVSDSARARYWLISAFSSWRGISKAPMPALVWWGGEH